MDPSTTPDSPSCICPICAKPFSEPRLLPCSHLLCTGCLSQLLQRGDQNLRCPVCQADIVTAKKARETRNTLDHEDFPVDESMVVMVSRDSILQERQCANCPGEEAGWMCFDCPGTLCEDCHAYHGKMKTLRHHNCLPLQDMTPELYAENIPVVCSLHEDKPAEFYCQKDRKPICGICHHDTHSFCPNVTTMDTKIQDSRADLNLLLREIATVGPSLERAINDLERIKEKIGEESKAGQSSVDAIFDSLHNALEERRACLKNGIKEKCDSVLNQKSEEQNGLKQKVTMMNRSMHVVARTVKIFPRSVPHSAVLSLRRHYRSLDLTPGHSSKETQPESLGVEIDQNAIDKILQDVKNLGEENKTMTSASTQTDQEVEKNQNVSGRILQNKNNLVDKNIGLTRASTQTDQEVEKNQNVSGRILQNQNNLGDKNIGLTIASTRTDQEGEIFQTDVERILRELQSLVIENVGLTTLRTQTNQEARGQDNLKRILRDIQSLVKQNMDLSRVPTQTDQARVDEPYVLIEVSEWFVHGSFNPRSSKSAERASPPVKRDSTSAKRASTSAKSAATSATSAATSATSAATSAMSAATSATSAATSATSATSAATSATSAATSASRAATSASRAATSVDCAATYETARFVPGAFSSLSSTRFAAPASGRTLGRVDPAKPTSSYHQNELCPMHTTDILTEEAESMKHAPKKFKTPAPFTEMEMEDFIAQAARRDQVAPSPTTHWTTVTTRENFQFHSKNGGSVVFARDRHEASFKGKASGGGIILTQNKISANALYEVLVERTTERRGRMSLGIVQVKDVSRLDIPAGVRCWTPAVVISSTAVTSRMTRKDWEQGSDLDNLSVGSTVGVLMDGEGAVHLFVDGRDRGVAAYDLSPHYPYHAFFQLTFTDGCTKVSSMPVRVLQLTS